MNLHENLTAAPAEPVALQADYRPAHVEQVRLNGPARREVRAFLARMRATPSDAELARQCFAEAIQA